MVEQNMAARGPRRINAQDHRQRRLGGQNRRTSACYVNLLGPGRRKRTLTLEQNDDDDDEDCKSFFLSVSIQKQPSL